MSQVAGALSSRGMEIGGALARERARGINTRFLHAGVREPGCLLVADPSKPVFKRWDFRVPVCVNSTRTGEGDARGRFERLGDIWWASWTFQTIGRRFSSPNRRFRPF